MHPAEDGEEDIGCSLGLARYNAPGISLKSAMTIEKSVIKEAKKSIDVFGVPGTPPKPATSMCLQKPTCETGQTGEFGNCVRLGPITGMSNSNCRPRHAYLLIMFTKKLIVLL